MNKTDVIQESERIFGATPGFVEQASEKWLVPTWGMVRDLLVRDSAIPRKYKALIALGTASFLHGRYTAYITREFTRALGLSNGEV